MTAADAMRPLPAPVTVAAGRDAARQAALPGTITYRSVPQAVHASESLTQTLGQLAAYGRDGLPVLTGDGGQPAGWITNDSVLRAIAREIGTAPPQPPTPQPPTTLTGYQVLEITIGPGAPGAGKAIGSITWPAGYLPVSVLHGSTRQEPHPDLVLAPGDQVSLLTVSRPR
jgi:hypothetical protein